MIHRIFADFLCRLGKRLVPFLDLSAWVLILVACVPLAFVAPSMLMTLGQWVVFALALGGIAVLLSRIIFPQIHLGGLVKLASEGNMAAALIASTVMFVTAIFFVGLVIWAKT